MALIRGILDRIVLLAAVLAGGAIPSFIAQYRQRVGGQLDQVLKDLAPFREIAQLRFGGDLQALVQYHLLSTDPTFHSEGQAIQQMVDAATRLGAAVKGLDGDLFRQFVYFGGHADAETASATWKSFVPSFSLSPDGLLFAAVFGVAIWLVFLGLWTLLAKINQPSRDQRVSRQRIG